MYRNRNVASLLRADLADTCGSKLPHRTSSSPRHTRLTNALSYAYAPGAVCHVRSFLPLSHRRRRSASAGQARSYRGLRLETNGAALFQGRFSDGFKFIFQTLGFFDASGEGRRPKDHNIGRSDAVVRSETR